MDFVSNQEPQIKEMLLAMGIAHVEELFRDIPKDLRLPAIAEDDGLSEFEGMKLVESLAAKNQFDRFESYLGAGAYEHHIPPLVNALCSNSEFLTSYTPYQAEASQGMLQAIFEFQSAICALTGMDVSNASVYDGPSACAEALLMSLRHLPERSKVLVAESLHPHYFEVVKLYLEREGIKLQIIPYSSEGVIDHQAFLRLLDLNTAGILIQSPNFLGMMENVKEMALHAHEKEALLILCSNPMAYGLYASAKELEVDIAVGDCQPFGIPLQFGGPYCGYMACRQNLLRLLPGRIVGETVDSLGRRGFVLTLQAREQHIRREKATSNICTNQALAALSSLIAMLWYGKEGIPQLALTNFQRASYLKERLEALPGIQGLGHQAFFNEFPLRFPVPISTVQKHFRQNGIEPGVDLGQFFPKWKDCLLINVTETKSKEQLDRYIQISSSIVA